MEKALNNSGDVGNEKQILKKPGTLFALPKSCCGYQSNVVFEGNSKRNTGNGKLTKDSTLFNGWNINLAFEEILLFAYSEDAA